LKLIFESSYLGWFVPLCIIAGIALALLLYYKSSFSKVKGIFSFPALLLTFLRFVTISLLLFFLLSPLLKNERERQEKPIILIAADNSRSIILNKDSGYYKTEFKSLIEKLPKDISGRFEVHTLTFGSEVKMNGIYDFTYNRTNFSNLLDYIGQQYYNRNLGAIVIASDGINNEGKDVIPLIADLKVPVYTIAMGDTTIYKDLLLQDIITNSIAYAGNNIPVRIQIQAGKCNGSKTQLQIRSENKVIASENFTITSSYFNKSFELNVIAEKAGLQRFIITLSQLDGENNYSNNSRSVYVDVLENKKSVIFIAAAPHPDVSAIKNSLTLHDNYQTKTILAAELPRSKQELEKLLAVHDIVVLHQLPSRTNPARDLLDAIETQNKPVFFILGSQTSIPQFNSLETGLKIIQKRDLSNTVLPVMDNTFNYFNLPDKIIELIPELPPLAVPFGEYRISQEAQVMMKQKIGQTVSNMPLLIFINSINARFGVLCGEGIWKWPLIEYKLNGNQLIFDELMNKSIQFLSVKADKRFFRFRELKSQFYEDEHVSFIAEVLNQSYEMLKGAKVKMTITDQSNKRKDYLFQEIDNGYNLDMGYLKPGSYRYVAVTNINGKDFSLTGELSVNEVDLEYMNTIADHNLLYKLAMAREGKMFYPAQTADLVKELNNNKNIKPMSFFESTISEFIEFKWLFFLIVILLGTEWFMRKFYGSY
jgi:hypothetical protein